MALRSMLEIKSVRVFLSLFCALLWGSVEAQQSNRENEAENQVRAQFVYNFANFVEWPKNAFKSKSDPIKICLFGEVYFAPYLYNFDGVMVGDRTLVVKKANSFPEIRSGCHILYVGEDERVHLPKFWSQIQYTYVLSVGERTGFADKGGIINIMSTHQQLQFEVNIENALINGLFLDSDLLSLARVIKRNSKRKDEQIQ